MINMATGSHPSEHSSVQERIDALYDEYRYIIKEELNALDGIHKPLNHEQSKLLNNKIRALFKKSAEISRKIDRLERRL